MELVIALAIGVLFSVGVYLVLSKACYVSSWEPL